jgi:sugar lactone lactonase YvrE
LARREDDGGITVIDDDLTVSNGLAWSPEGTTLYSVDSGPGTIWARAYDATTGAVGERRPLLTVENGTPDGMCADADGNLWIAIFGAGEVRCHAPDGVLLATVTIPGAPHVTSLAFAGPDLDTLVITTARHELSPAQRDRDPDSGRLFVADVDAVGFPVPLWRR